MTAREHDEVLGLGPLPTWIFGHPRHSSNHALPWRSAEVERSPVARINGEMVVTVGVQGRSERQTDIWVVAR